MAKRTTKSGSSQTSGSTAGGSTSGDTADTYGGGSTAVDQARDAGGPDAGNSTRNASMGSEPSEEEIRVRAYRRYLERGGGDGQDFEDWLEAERELKGR